MRANAGDHELHTLTSYWCLGSCAPSMSQHVASDCDTVPRVARAPGLCLPRAAFVLLDVMHKQRERAACQLTKSPSSVAAAPTSRAFSFLSPTLAMRCPAAISP